MARIKLNKRTPSIVSIGKTYNRLKVLKIIYKRKGEAWAICKCICGNEVSKRLYNIRNGTAQSCGCLHREIAKSIGKRVTTHGDTKNKKWTSEYYVHFNMKQRCYNLKNKSYKNYGGRGISVYKPWHKYKNFLKYLLKTIGRKPGKKYTLDRIDNDGNYEPGNIQWATYKQQNKNRRRFKRRAL